MTWSRVCLLAVLVGLAGIMLYLVSEYAYPHDFFIVGANTKVADLSDLPGWVAFYREFHFVVVPAIILVTGLAGLFPHGALENSKHRIQSWWQQRNSDGLAIERKVAQINVRQLVAVAVVAVVFGGFAGWLGGNFKMDWVKGEETVRRAPTFSFEDRQEQRLREVADARIRERVRCLEDRLDGVSFFPC